jgi:hypothetical protein
LVQWCNEQEQEMHSDLLSSLSDLIRIIRSQCGYMTPVHQAQLWRAERLIAQHRAAGELVESVLACRSQPSPPEEFGERDSG